MSTSNTPQQNIAAANGALAKVKAHCMAARVKRDRQHLLVYFPPGYRLDGVRVTMANGVKWACEQALSRMEREWQAVQL